MFDYKLDNYSFQNTANDFKEAFDFPMKDFNFLPSIDIAFMFNMSPEVIASMNSDIWDGPLMQEPKPRIDLEKLSRYF